VEQPHGAGERNFTVEQQVRFARLEEGARRHIGLIAIGRFFDQRAFGKDDRLFLRRETPAGEVGRRGDADQWFAAIGIGYTF
jgi:hypothetical protein